MRIYLKWLKKHVMYLMYTDESGDTGLNNSPTRYFILTGLVIHELRWKLILENLVTFRRFLRESKGLKIREEIHAVNFINKPGGLQRIKRNDRLDIMKKCIDWLNDQKDIGIITVVIDKRNCKKDVFDKAWNTLINRFENTIRHQNFPGPKNPDDKGLLVPDNTNGEELTRLVRRMRHYNPVANKKDFYSSGYRDIKLEYLIEDPFMKDSANSLLHQMVDVVAYCARQMYEPNNYMKNKGGTNFYKRLHDVVIKQASSKHALGIVEL